MRFESLNKELFYRSLRIRMVEEKIIELYPSDKIQSPVHLSIGQEAVAVGACYNLTAADLLFCSYRSHAFYLAKGGDLREMMAELYGKVTGCGKGKAGSMHLAAPEVGLMGASAVVASTIPHAVGAALAAQRLKKDHIVVAAFGDGASDEGVYHESLNFAALHKLPVIFLCENNSLAVHSRLDARQAYQLQAQARLYGLPTTYVPEGYDPGKVQEAMARVIQEARETRLPQFVEVLTCRYREHVGPGDDFDKGYRSRGDLERWQAMDPLIQNRELVKQYGDRIREEIEEAVRFAEESPWPGQEELLTDVI